MPDPRPPRRTPLSAEITVRLPEPHREAATRVVQLLDPAHDNGGLRPATIVPQRAGVRGSSYYPVTREARIDLRSDIPHYETAHELAHWIDHGDSGDVNYRLSEHAASAALNAWRSAVRDTTQGRALKFAAGSQPWHRRLAVACRWRELWARSYAQWLSRCTRDPALQRDLDSLRDAIDAETRLLHWTDADFDPIHEAINAVLTERGWLP